VVHWAVGIPVDEDELEVLVVLVVLVEVDVIVAVIQVFEMVLLCIVTSPVFAKAAP
jgi:hypothetical protein